MPGDEHVAGRGVVGTRGNGYGGTVRTTGVSHGTPPGTTTVGITVGITVATVGITVVFSKTVKIVKNP